MTKKTINIKGIVELFGGKHQIVSDYNSVLRIIITPKAVEKWLERGDLPMKHNLNLQSIAEKRGIEYKLEAFVK